MNFILSAVFVYGFLAAVAAPIVHLLTRRRVRPPMARGRAEVGLLLAASLIGGPIPDALGTWAAIISHQTHVSEEAGIVGLTLAMPLSAISAWVAGELTTGPTRPRWLPMIVAFVSAELGFFAGMVVSYFADKAICSGLGVTQVRTVWLLHLLLSIPVLFGGVSAALAYYFSRGEFARGTETREHA